MIERNHPAFRPSPGKASPPSGPRQIQTISTPTTRKSDAYDIAGIEDRAVCPDRIGGGGGALRQHFLDMGVIPGAEVELVRLAPLGDPMELRIHGYELTLRLADADHIGVTPIHHPAQEPAKSPPCGGSRPTWAWARTASTTPRAAATRCRRARC